MGNNFSSNEFTPIDPTIAAEGGAKRVRLGTTQNSKSQAWTGNVMNEMADAIVCSGGKSSAAFTNYAPENAIDGGGKRKFNPGTPERAPTPYEIINNDSLTDRAARRKRLVNLGKAVLTSNPDYDSAVDVLNSYVQLRTEYDEYRDLYGPIATLSQSLSVPGLAWQRKVWAEKALKSRERNRDGVSNAAVLLLVVSAGRPNRVLVVRDRVTKRWMLPGGGLKIGEAPEQGAEREYREETSFPLPEYVSSESYYYYPERTVIFKVITNTTPGYRQTEETDDALLTTVDSLLDGSFERRSGPIVDYVKQGLRDMRWDNFI